MDSLFQMLVHGMRLIGRAVGNLPDALGSAWFAFLLSGIVSARDWRRHYKSGGWIAVGAHWQASWKWWGFAAAFIFCWSFILVTNKDHNDLVKNTGVLREKLKKETDSAAEQARLNAENLSNEKQRCARLEGANDTLGRQTLAQQSTINNCQTQALKLLAPIPFKMTPLVLEDQNDTAKAEGTMKFLILSNKTITPVRMTGQCDRNLISASVSVVGNESMAGGAQVYGANSFVIGVTFPAWSEISPMLLTLQYRGPKEMTCDFSS